MLADPDLVRRIAASTGLPPSHAARTVDDVLAFYAETVEAFVRRRHTELQAAGGRNDRIFAQLILELEHRLVSAPELTERQLRRIVYG